jgi:diguanylate cyclase (GGDEF)-like protein
MPLTSLSSNDDLTRLERVKVFFAHSVNNLPALLVGSLLVAASLKYAGAPMNAIGAITALTVICAAAVAALALHVRRTGLTTTNCVRFLRLHVSLALTMALAYGLSVFLIPADNTHAEHTLLFLLLSTAVTTIALGYSVYPPYYLFASLLCLAPMTGRFFYLYFQQGDTYYLLLFGASVLWQVIVMGKTLMVSRTVLESIHMNQQLRKEIQEHLRARETINHMAMHDELTGLANRRYFEQAFERTLNQTGRNEEHFGVLSIDLNSFKPVNDTYGHATGDHLLKIVAERLRKATRSSDFCARIGGDEFVVMCTSVNTASDLEELARKIKQTLCQPFEPDDNLVNTSASVGWALYPEDGNNLSHLMASADKRMYADKRAHKGVQSA